MTRAILVVLLVLAGCGGADVAVPGERAAMLVDSRLDAQGEPSCPGADIVAPSVVVGDGVTFAPDAPAKFCRWECAHTPAVEGCDRNSVWVTWTKGIDGTWHLTRTECQPDLC